MAVNAETWSLKDERLDRVLSGGFESLFESGAHISIASWLKRRVRANAQRAVEEHRGRSSELLAYVSKAPESMSAGLASGAYLTLTGDMGPVTDCLWGGLGAGYVDNGKDMRYFLDGVSAPVIKGPKFYFAELGGSALAGRVIEGEENLDGCRQALCFSDLYGAACIYARTKYAMRHAVLHDFAGAHSRNFGSLGYAVLLDNALKGSRNKRSLDYCTASGNAGRNSVNAGCLTRATITEDAFRDSRLDIFSLLEAKYNPSILCGADRFHRAADGALDIIFFPITRPMEFMGDKFRQFFGTMSVHAGRQDA